MKCRSQSFRSAGGVLVLLAGLVCLHGANALSGAMDLAAQLLQSDARLVPASKRDALDGIHRQLRELDQQLRDAQDESRRTETRRRMATVDAQLATLLESFPDARRFHLQTGRLDPSLSEPIAMPADEGALLFRFAAAKPDSAKSEPRFVAQSLDQSRPEHAGTIRFECAGAGVTWVLVSFSNLPVGLTSLPLEIRLANGAPIRTHLHVRAPEFGRLRLTILDDDHEDPTPAMVRITSKPSGRDRRPANAIDFAPQFDGNGRATGQRHANLPGRLGGDWWCVPGPIDMSLPPGEYSIAVRRGVEHVPVFEELAVVSKQLTETTVRPRRWVDMRKLGWYSGDDHVHGRIMSDGDAERLMAWVRAEDIHVANVVKMGDIYRTWFEQRGWGKHYRVMERDYVLSPGQECPRTHDQIGHTLSMNTQSMIRDTDRYYLYDWVADEVHAQGGLFGYAHVNSDNFFVHRDMTLNVPQGKIDFGEVLQFNHLGTDVWYQFLNLGFKFTAAAGSDVPWGGTVGEVRLYAYLGQEPFSADAWFEAVRRGRTFVTSGPMIELRVDNAVPGDEIQLGASVHRFRVRARAWSPAERARPKRLVIVRHGAVVREIGPGADDADELKLDIELDGGDGCWVAARAESADGTAAHTTPVYLVRPGLRFWDFEQIDRLLELRLKSLEEIEGIVAEAQARERRGDLEADRPRHLLAAQGSALLERVARARKIYEALRETAARERGLRGRR